MADQTFSGPAEQVQNAFKQSSELFAKTTASLMDAYSKQMNTGYEFYKKLTDSTPWGSLIPSGQDGKTQWTDLIKESTASYQKVINNSIDLSEKIMEKTVEAFTENEWSPLSKKSADAILNIFTRQAEQSRDFGKHFLDALQNEELLSPGSFKKQSSLFNELMSKSIKSSEHNIKEMIETYNEQASHSQEATKKLMANIQQQTDALAKTQAKFTEELTHTLSAKKASAGKTTKRTRSKQ